MLDSIRKITVFAVCMLVGAAVMAADREQYTITTLRIGTGAQQVSGDGNQLLERLLTGTNEADVIEGRTGFFDGAVLAGKPSRSFVFMDDFFTFLKATNVTEGTTLLAPWSYTGDNGVALDCTVGASAGGVLSMITGATSNNEAYIQYGVAETEGSFSISSNGTKKLWFEARFTPPSTAANSANFIGLSEVGSSAANFITDSTGALADKDYMGFHYVISGGATNVNFTIHNNAQTAQVCTNVAYCIGSVLRLGFYFDGATTLTVYSDETANSRTFTINDAVYPTSTKMSPIIASKTLTASYSPTNQVDYIYVQQAR